jgi:hypothetical protein
MRDLVNRIGLSVRSTFDNMYYVTLVEEFIAGSTSFQKWEGGIVSSLWGVNKTGAGPGAVW